MRRSWPCGAPAKKLGNYRLKGCDLYVTIEPCAMCAGAIIQARLRRVVYGTPDPKAGACGSALAVLNHPKVNHQVEVVSGVLAEECAGILREFFRKRRRKRLGRLQQTSHFSRLRFSSFEFRTGRRGTEAVITGAPRKRLACQKRARGFESHPLRQPISLRLS